MPRLFLGVDRGIWSAWISHLINIPSKHLCDMSEFHPEGGFMGRLLPQSISRAGLGVLQLFGNQLLLEQTWGSPLYHRRGEPDLRLRWLTSWSICPDNWARGHCPSLQEPLNVYFMYHPMEPPKEALQWISAVSATYGAFYLSRQGSLHLNFQFCLKSNWTFQGWPIISPPADCGTASAMMHFKTLRTMVGWWDL